jgi:translocation and assembly module TamB
VFFQGDPPIPGFRVQYRFRKLLGLSVESTYQPRYFLLPPTLGQQDPQQTNALGLFLVRQWRF